MLIRSVLVARRLVLAGAGVVGLAVAAWALWSSSGITQQLAVTHAAGDAQTRCYRLIHDDTEAFDACLAALLRDEAAGTPRRLGIEYFGVVGALNSARMGMRGAEHSARAFLRGLRATQAALRLTDRQLCAAIPGDCQARIARMRLLETTAFAANDTRER